ncbi:MAG TPA: thioesterase family protein [Candidatus Thermoplasmatota archaeon]|nr:thioesterase family protein [Candidatus Thermoplasmatota archaeon]
MDWPVEVEIKVPWRDVDAAGHVNNAVYFSYMETARAEAFLRARGAGRRWQDVDMILARAEADFRSAATFGDTLLVRTWPTRVGGSSFALGYRILDKATGRVVLEGASVQVMYDYAQQRKKPVPEPLRAALEAGLP